MHPRVLLVAFVALAAASPASAGSSLGPTRSSDLAVFHTQFDPCPIGGGHVLNWLARSDGTAGPLDIPPGKVLVITEVETSTIALIEGGSAGHGLNLILQRQTPPLSNQMVGYTSGVYDAGEQFAHTFTFPTGVVLRPGSVLCAVAFRGDVSRETPVTAIAHGYFAKDN